MNGSVSAHVLVKRGPGPPISKLIILTHVELKTGTVGSEKYAPWVLGVPRESIQGPIHVLYPTIVSLEQGDRAHVGLFSNNYYPPHTLPYIRWINSMVQWIDHVG